MWSEYLWQHATNDNEKVMSRFYGVFANEYKPIYLILTNKEVVFERYGKQGCAIIPALFSFKEEIDCDELVKNFIKILQKSKYRFLPLYKFLRDDSGFEGFFPFFAVFPRINTGNAIKEDYDNFQNFSEFILERCSEFSLTPFLTKSQECGLNHLKKETYFANPFPTTYSELMRRTLSGEIMLLPKFSI
ncbi:hypothetical protein [Fibrobacter intestinalis]|uniref:Uncharacterized protein n=1 Tax=Fibrobacter intestinalis TaxID=28122 RepID=A0A1T4KCX0_9BACT|nr:MULTISPECIES: hypothetical protein [Fibrobacter]PBC73859.1 hypothetical protein BGW94_1484 [Fibrobacter sp. NR9]SJZ40298.1 hypothetical protein SAMN02745108_00440 [Fibrobacter intestinalis]